MWSRKVIVANNTLKCTHRIQALYNNNNANLLYGLPYGGGGGGVGSGSGCSRNIHTSSTCLNRRIPYDLVPIDIKLNDTIEYAMFDELKECEVFCRRVDIDTKYHNDVSRLIKTDIFNDIAYGKTVANMTNGYFLTQKYLAELIDQSYKSKLPARLTKLMIEFLMSRKSIVTASNFVGFNDLVKKSNSYFQLSTIQDVQFSSEDKIVSNLTTSSSNSNSVDEDDGADIKYKHDHVDDNDILCDKFYQFIDLCNAIWSEDKVKKLLEDFLLPNINAMNWLDDICNKFPTCMEYIKFMAQADNPDANLQFKLTKNYNYEITDHKHSTVTGYIFIDDHLISTYTDKRPHIVRQHIAYNTLIKLINKARN